MFFPSGLNDPATLPTIDQLRSEFDETADDRCGVGFNVVFRGFPNDFVAVVAQPEEDGRVAHFMVSRPTVHEALWSGLYRILRRYHFCSFWPAETCPPVIGREDVILYPEMLETLGPPRLLTSGAELARWVRESD
ncbi:MAG: hypothetical protein AAGA20_09640 [Planctomycetota bacterium]